MKVGINISNTWKTTKNIYINISSSWKSCKNVYTKVSGTWKPIWSYNWFIGGWSQCSATCGGGTQTRSVTCMRADGFVSSDDKCSSLVGPKPISQQSCNTHTCVECNYQHSSCLQDQYTFRMKYVKNPDWGKDSFQQSEYVWGGIILAYSYSEGETARTINGYYYTKSTSQTSCIHSDSYTLQVYTYTICRQPI